MAEIYYETTITEEHLRDLIDVDLESPAEPVIDSIDIEGKEVKIKFHMER